MQNNEKKSRKERETQLRRQIIIEAAEKLFKSKGYENTTMDEIAHESEFSKGTVYNYFNSKDDLYIAIGIRAYKFIIQHTKEFTIKQEPGLNQIKAVGYAYYEFTKTYPYFANIFHDIAKRFPDIATKSEKVLTNFEKEYLSYSNQYKDIFMKILSDATNVGAIRTDKHPYMIGYILSTLTNGLVNDLMQNKRIVDQLNLNPDEIVDFVFDIIAEGLKPREI